MNISKFVSTRNYGSRGSGLNLSATNTLIVICVLVWVMQYFVSPVTSLLWYAPVYALPHHFEPWRMLTVMFTHSTSGFAHIASNMFTLFMFGNLLEHYIGKLKFVLLYILAGWGGSVLVTLWVYADPASLQTPTVGASGAIFGVMGAVLVRYRHFYLRFRSLAVMLFLNLVVGFLPGSNISWQGHVGGLLIGMLVMWALTHPRVIGKKAAESAVFIGVVVLLSALSVNYFVVYHSIK